MTRTLLLTLAAAAALAACGKSDHTIVAGGEPEEPAANSSVANTPVTLPPSIQASKTYRCKDNSLVYIDWLSDGTSRVKKSADDLAGTMLPAGDPSLTGSAKAPTITYKGQSCKA